MSYRDTQNPGIGGLDELTIEEELLIQNLAGISFVQGDIIYHNGSNLTRLAAGTSGHFLKTQGAGANPLWADVGSSGSGITRTITTSSGSFTAGSTADVDYVYPIAGAHAVALPTAVGNTNRYTFKNNHSAAITITPDGSETIEGSATIQVAPEDSVDLISNNSNWFVI